MKKISNGIYMLSGSDKMEEAKAEMQFKNSNLSLVGVGKDTNGNSVVKVKYPNDPAFSIQTGSIQKVHDLVRGQKMKDILALSDKDKATIEKEVTDYVKKYGSAKQKSGLKEAGKTEQRLLKPGQKLYTEDGKLVEVEEGDCLKGNVLSEDTYDYNMIMDFVKKNPDDEYMNTMQLVGDNSKTKFMNVPNTILIDLAKMMKNK